MAMSFEEELEAIEAELVANLAAEREAAGMTRAELSEAIGGYRTLITKLETGKLKLRAGLFVKIAEGLNQKPSTLMRRAWDDAKK